MLHFRRIRLRYFNIGCQLAPICRPQLGSNCLVNRLMATAEPTDQQISDVIMAVAQCGGLEYARDRAQLLASQAESALESLAPSPATEALRASITYVLDRRR